MTTPQWPPGSPARSRNPAEPQHQTEPLPGYLCEQCLDAPATRMQPAPWGGEMGVCRTCTEQGDPMAPFAQQPSPQRSTPSLCAHCGREAAWMCENYCPPHVSGGLRGTPPAACSCGSTVWVCAYCGKRFSRTRPSGENPSGGGVRRRGVPRPPWLDSE